MNQVGNGQRALRQDGHAGARPQGFQAAGHGRADVVAGRQEGPARDLVGQRTVNKNFGLALDEGLDLRLPLFGADKAGRAQQGQYLLRAADAEEEFLHRAVRRHALAAFAGQDQAGRPWPGSAPRRSCL